MNNRDIKTTHLINAYNIGNLVISCGFGSDGPHDYLMSIVPNTINIRDLLSNGLRPRNRIICLTVEFSDTAGQRATELGTAERLRRRNEHPGALPRINSTE